MTSTSTNCCTIIRSELNPCQEYYSSTDSTGWKLDIEESFAPYYWTALLSKVALTAFTAFTWVYTFIESDNKDFYFAFLTNWTLALQLIYQGFSLWNSVSPPPGVNTRIKISWYLFNMVAHTNLVVTLLYWATVYDPDETELSFKEVAPHGATCIVCLIDGFLVNRIPIRLYHWFSAVLPIDIAYPVWTIIHSVLDIGNPTKSDEDDTTNDDAIYTAVEWQDDVAGTAIFIVIVVFVVGPLFQLLLFVLSLYSPCCRISRRYEEDEHDKVEANNGSDEDMYAVSY